MSQTEPDAAHSLSDLHPDRNPAEAGSETSSDRVGFESVLLHESLVSPTRCPSAKPQHLMGACARTKKIFAETNEPLYTALVE